MKKGVIEQSAEWNNTSGVECKLQNYVCPSSYSYSYFNILFFGVQKDS